MGNKNSSLLAAVYLLISYLPYASAQGYSTGFGGSNPEASLVEFFNEMVFYTFEAGSVAEITLYFVAPLFGFYMINKNIFALGFESFEERIDRDSWSRTDDNIPTGLKGVALAVAFMTVQVAGMLGTILLLIAGGLAFIAWFLNHIGLLSDWSGNGSNFSSTDRSEAESETEDVAQKAAEALNIASEEEEEAKQDVEEGNALQADEEARSAQQDIERAINQLEKVEGNLQNFMKRDREDVERALREAKEFVEKEREEFDGIKDFMNKAGKLEDSISALADSMESGNGSSISIEDAIDQYDDNVAPITQVLKSDIERFNSINKDLEALEIDEFNRLVEVVKEYNMAKKTLNTVHEAVQKAESEEQFMENLSRRLEDSDLSDEVGMTEERLENLAKTYSSLRSSLQDQKKGIKRAKKFLEKELKIERGGVKKIKMIKNQMLPDIKDDLDRMRSALDSNYAKTDKYEAMQRRIKELDTLLDDMHDKIQRIIDEEAQLGEKIETFVSDLRHALRRGKKLD